MAISPIPITDPPKVIWRTPRSVEGYLRWELMRYGYEIERYTKEKPNFMGG